MLVQQVVSPTVSQWGYIRTGAGVVIAEKSKNTIYNGELFFPIISNSDRGRYGQFSRANRKKNNKRQMSCVQILLPKKYN